MKPSSNEDIIPDPSELSTAAWFKSSMSSATQGCVEITHLSNGTAVRDSKHPERGHLFFTPHEWESFLDGAEKGEFNR